MNQKYKAVCWLCLTILITAGLKYVPTYLVQERALDQQDRVIDLKERAYLQATGTAPTISIPAPVKAAAPSQLL